MSPGDGMTMSEAQWLASTDPQEMLRFLEGKVSKRKLRLFACACSRQNWDLLADSSRKAVEMAERYADGLVGKAELATVHKEAYEVTEQAKSEQQRIAADEAYICSFVDTAYVAEYPTRETPGVPLRLQAALLRDIAGNPFRSVACADGEDSTTYPPHPDDCRCLLRPWLTRDVLGLAEAIDEERAWERMPILADALQEAGCDNEDILRHCRGWEICTWCVAGGTRPVELLGGICTTCQGTGWIALRGPHVRGCHVIDSILDKS
jgi:hypothetical protein